MTERERQRELDGQVARFLSALEEGDLDAAARIWSAAASYPDLESALADVAAELAAEYARDDDEREGGLIETTVKAAMPTAEVIRVPTGPSRSPKWRT
jgi:hypothetical protein